MSERHYTPSVESRLDMIEGELQRLASFKKWIGSLALLVIVQLLSFAYTWGQVVHQLDNLPTTRLQKVVDVHEEQIDDIRNRVSRLQGMYEALIEIEAGRQRDQKHQ